MTQGGGGGSRCCLQYVEQGIGKIAVVDVECESDVVPVELVLTVLNDVDGIWQEMGCGVML